MDASIVDGLEAHGRGVGRCFSMSGLAPPETVFLDIAGQEVVFRWGKPHELGTAAYWVEQTRMRRPSSNHRLGGSLAEEMVACVLGGFGLPADVGLAAFEEVRKRGLICLSAPPTSSQVQAVLERPISVRGRAKPLRYRFPRQRATRVSAALHFLAEHPAPEDSELRDWLLAVPGIGPKTASWIARNWVGAENVAIIDIHIQRAGVAAGFFRSDWKLPRDYAAFEAAFCAVAKQGKVSCAALDARIWRDLSYLGRAADLLLGTPPDPALI